MNRGIVREFRLLIETLFGAENRSLTGRMLDIAIPILTSSESIRIPNSHNLAYVCDRYYSVAFSLLMFCL